MSARDLRFALTFTAITMLVSPTTSNSDVSDGLFRVRKRAAAVACRLDLTLTGAAADDNFGYSVRSAGDVNGDGFDDVIVGAWLNDAGGLNAGRAYVYHGGPAADAVADLTLTGAAAGDFFGISAGSAGDVNGDGFDDVIVGAYANDAGGLDAGRAYVYHGGPAADAVADLTLTGAAADDLFGVSVGSAGDVNGDGFDDVIVGAYANDAGGLDAGRAYVYHGGPAADAVADLTLTGAVADDQFGISVGNAGDVNGDGFDDVIVGAYFNDAGGPDAGRAYVYHGAPAADAVADLTLTGAAGDRFGVSVGSAGDLNGDGFDDVIVGANLNDAGGTNAGRAYVYHGGPAADAVADLTLTGEAADDQFGISVGSAGDVNGDGFDDVVVGAHANGAGGANAGRAYVYHGGPAVDAVADLTLTGAETGDRFGFSVGSAGDVNGDGFDDVIVGAYANDAGGTDAGRAYVYDCNHHVVTGLLGETTLGLLTPLAAWPSPYRGGDLIVSFATLGGLQGGMGPAEVVLYDVAGRAVRTIVRGAFAAGSQRAAWDGLDEKGSPVSSGTYFLRVRTAGNTHTQKLVVIR